MCNFQELKKGTNVLLRVPSPSFFLCIQQKIVLIKRFTEHFQHVFSKKKTPTLLPSVLTLCRMFFSIVHVALSDFGILHHILYSANMQFCGGKNKEKRQSIFQYFCQHYSNAVISKLILFLTYPIMYLFFMYIQSGTRANPWGKKKRFPLK